MRALIALSLLVACGDTPEAAAPAAAAAAATAAPAPAAAPPPPPAPPPAPPATAAATPAAATDAAPVNENGERIYNTNCVACHQADGTGMNGMLAGNFVADKARLARSDDELLASIRDGKTGPIGAMPPWKAVLSEQDMKDVLAYIRGKYGG